MRTILIYIFFLSNFISSMNAQCFKTATSDKFKFEGHTYILVKNKFSWQNAAKCAVESGGYLAHINNRREQKNIFEKLKKTITNPALTIANDGGGASYVWLGGTDLHHEGVWIWDGDNDGIGMQFWQGGVDGNPVGNNFVNWGHEPDNFNGHQNALAIALTEWPLGIGSLGQQGQWNDLNENDRLYFLIEINH